MPPEAVAGDAQPHRRWLVWLLAARFVGGAVVVYLAYVLLVDWSRFVEAGAVGRLLEPVASGRVNADFARGEGILFLFPDGADLPIAAHVTRSCTVLTPVAIVAWVALCATRGSIARRGVGLAVSIASLIVFDVLRISAVVLAGATWGTSAMVLTHDWVGTLMTLLSLVLGMLLLWIVTGVSFRRRSPHVAAT